MSATVRPKTLGLLGIADTEYEFIEYPSIFPKERRPIYRIPTVRLNKNSDADDYRTWVQRIDQWISKRLDRKGIVHTVSYNRAKLLLEQSSYKKYMMAHSSKNTRAVVEAFRKSSAPAILVSPVMDTGYDFQGDTARWQAIGKMPWPDTRSAVMRARIEKDPDYAAYLTAQALVQMCGRICRSEEDWGETGIFDDNFNWFVRKYNEFLPQHFKESVRWVQTIPEPLKL